MNTQAGNCVEDRVGDPSGGVPAAVRAIGSEVPVRQLNAHPPTDGGV
jgi:hypothetical protein